MQFKSRSLRLVALLTGCVVASTAFGTAPAHAASKSKNWKYGAIAAGVAGAYLLSKGKVAPAAAVAAGGYYAYEKGEDAKADERYDDRRDRYGYRDRNGNYGSNAGGYGGYRYNDSRDGSSRYDGSRDGERYGSNAGGDIYPDSNGSYGAQQYRGNAEVRGRGNDGHRNGHQNSTNYDLRPYRR